MMEKGEHSVSIMNVPFSIQARRYAVLGARDKGAGALKTAADNLRSPLDRSTPSPPQSSH
jgi:hypothetical protein